LSSGDDQFTTDAVAEFVFLRPEPRHPWGWKIRWDGFLFEGGAFPRV
jgi:hypothetical protein